MFAPVSCCRARTVAPALPITMLAIRPDSGPDPRLAVLATSPATPPPPPPPAAVARLKTSSTSFFALAIALLLPLITIKSRC